MNRRQRGESLSARLRSEVQVSAALWQSGAQKAATADGKTGGKGHQATGFTSSSTGAEFACPREVKPLLFFYKYLQPIRAAEGVGTNNDGNGGPLFNTRKLRVNLPLTVVCERTNAQEMVLWLRTDAQGNVVRAEKTPLWRKKLHSELVVTLDPAVHSSSTHENDPVLAVRSVARRKGSSSNGGSAVVLTRRTLDPVLAAPCELPICIQQFVHCRGSQASVYRVFWCPQERKCFAVNLTSSLKSTEAPEDANADSVSGGPTTTSGSNLSASTMAAMNAAFEAAMATAAQVSKFYCVTVSPDARECARWPKLRGVAITEGVQATSRVVEHVQLQLPALQFHSMTADFIKDTNGVWWLTRIVDFNASSCVEPPRDEECFSSRDSAVIIPEALRLKPGQLGQEPQLEGESPPRESVSARGADLNNAPNARVCFLCGCSCELTPTFQSELQSMLKGHSVDDHKTSSAIPTISTTADEYRMTLTMALDTIFWMRQRGVALSVWENAVSTVRKSQVRDVCDFPVCMLCYRVYQQQSRLQLIARELHHAFSPTAASVNDLIEGSDALTSAADESGVGMAASAASGLSASQLLSTELRQRLATPKSVLDILETYRSEAIPPALLLRGDSPETKPSWSTLTPVRGADVDPTATQMRLVFFFHELQDGGPDLVPTDFFLEYHLGQSVTRVQLEGSKRHTPNRWQLAEARVHYLCATLTAFSEFCSHKRLLIKMKAKPQADLNDGNATTDEGDTDQTRKEEFFGYALLSLRQVITAAKCFNNSLQPESRTDYLLELHTAAYGLLTLKLTVGLLVDPVPLGHVRDVLRDRIFLEEQPPRGVYWPPPTYCLGGLAVPRDWVGALMPSEYTKLLPMRRREAPGKHHLGRSGSRTQSQNHAKIHVASAETSPSAANSLTNIVDKPPSDHALERELALGDINDSVVHDNQILRSMTGRTLSGACMTAKRLIVRVTEDRATKNFPTALLAAILRYASFANPCFSLATWNSPAIFQFARRFSVDRLLAEVKPGNLPTLALLGELLLVLLQDHSVPDQVDVSALERLLEPFWQPESGWRAVPRTQTNCLPEHRVIWNRAIRRWGAANADTASDEPDLYCEDHDMVMASITTDHIVALTKDVGDFRSKTLTFVLCELFEHMETLDNGYIEIAELRSLAKCLPEEEYLCDEEQLDPEVGMRERLAQEDIEALVRLVEQQRRLAVRTLLHSLMASAVMEDALARFDRKGSSEMSLEEFRELTSEALLTQRRVFRAFQEEPRHPQLGFCLRHGVTELYASDSVCVLCAFEYQVEKSPDKPSRSLEKSPDVPDIPVSPHANTNVDGDRIFSNEGEFSGELDSATTRRSSSPPRLEKHDRRKSRLSSGTMVLENIPDETAKDPTFRRRRAVVSKPGATHLKIDAELGNMLERLHAAERTIVNGEAQVVERKSSVTSLRSRQSSTSATNETPPHNSSCTDFEFPTKTTTGRRKNTGKAEQLADTSAGSEKTSPKTKKRMKKRVLNKTARRVSSTPSLPTSASMSKLLRMEFCDRKRSLTTSASESLIQKATRLEEKRKQLDKLVLEEVQEVKRRLAKLLDDVS